MLQPLVEVTTLLPLALKHAGNNVLRNFVASDKQITRCLRLHGRNFAQSVHQERPVEFCRTVRAECWNQSGLGFSGNWCTGENCYSGDGAALVRPANRRDSCWHYLRLDPLVWPARN